MYWKVNDKMFLVQGITRRFQCWGEIEIPEHGCFERSSSYLLVDDCGSLVKRFGESISTSVQEEFHISDIHFISNNMLLSAHYVNIDLKWNRVHIEVKLEGLNICSKKDVAKNVLKLLNEYRQHAENFPGV